jgi:hypothetical protein
MDVNINSTLLPFYPWSTLIGNLSAMKHTVRVFQLQDLGERTDSALYVQEGTHVLLQHYIMSFMIVIVSDRTRTLRSI